MRLERNGLPRAPGTDGLLPLPRVRTSPSSSSPQGTPYREGVGRAVDLGPEGEEALGLAGADPYRWPIEAGYEPEWLYE